ncbi:MAG: hypothetical protein CMJ50_02435, partial [Planctomycetaceae bacterium]|nr:hypothetical protein [Planctomycetaceae bacterium]
TTRRIAYFSLLMEGQFQQLLNDETGAVQLGFVSQSKYPYSWLDADFEQEDAEEAEFSILPSLFPLCPPVHLSYPSPTSQGRDDVKKANRAFVSTPMPTALSKLESGVSMLLASGLALMNRQLEAHSTESPTPNHALTKRKPVRGRWKLGQPERKVSIHKHTANLILPILNRT